MEIDEWDTSECPLCWVSRMKEPLSAGLLMYAYIQKEWLLFYTFLLYLGVLRWLNVSVFCFYAMIKDWPRKCQCYVPPFLTPSWLIITVVLNHIFVLCPQGVWCQPSCFSFHEIRQFPQLPDWWIPMPWNIYFFTVLLISGTFHSVGITQSTFWEKKVSTCRNSAWIEHMKLRKILIGKKILLFPLTLLDTFPFGCGLGPAALVYVEAGRKPSLGSHPRPAESVILRRPLVGLWAH